MSPAANISPEHDPRWPAPQVSLRSSRGRQQPLYYVQVARAKLPPPRTRACRAPRTHGAAGTRTGESSQPRGPGPQWEDVGAARSNDSGDRGTQGKAAAAGYVYI